MKRWLVVLVLLLMGLVGRAGAADEPAAGATYKLERADISVKDEFGRPYQTPAETAWVVVRLAQGDSESASVKDLKSLATEGVEYDTDADTEWPTGGAGQGYNSFKLDGGTARVEFVVFQDQAKNPINYEMALYEKAPDGTKKMTTKFKKLYEAGNAAGKSEMTAGVKRPLTGEEKAILAVFVIVSICFSYLLLGRDLFRRMLFNRRMEVTAAVSMSNLLFLGFVVLTAVLAELVYYYPVMMWKSVYGVYAAASFGYLAILLVSFLIGWAMTRR
ncbi:MAG TPA: hypothetical protein VGO93_11360 [Candidatus Xenobia bacterium]|jgi:hypothetical protein